MSFQLGQIRKVGFTLKPNDSTIKTLFIQIKKMFEQRGIEVLLSLKSAKLIGHDGVAFETMCKEVNFLVSLGGDGTLLSLVRRSYHFKKPVLGINAGNLGFLADINISQVGSFLDSLLAGKYRIDERMMMEGFIRKNGKKDVTFFAFNDVVITRPSISKMVKINASIDSNWFNTYRGDGLIVSTPTGSTAYNLAVGGPVMYPLTQAFIMSPISPHSLTQRPLVVPADFTIELTSPDETVIAVIDGQDDYTMHKGDILHICGARRGAMMLHRLERNYFDVLREKLHWGDSI
mgnify:CR=1 FL=1